MSKKNERAGPEDAHELAFRVVQQVTGQAERIEPEESVKAKAGRMASLKGGKARYDALTPERRVEIAKAAELGYTTEQFHADLKRASRKVKSMAAEARKDYREGKTEQFPGA